MFVAGIEIKTPNKHVVAASDVVTGLGFKSPRLQFSPQAKIRGERVESREGKKADGVE